jgi:hypothetical protein
VTELMVGMEAGQLRYQLIEGLQGLNHGLSCDDLVALAKELDQNGDCEISLHEFEAIIET